MVLNLNEPADPSNPEFSVCDALNAKHPPTQPLHPECLLPLADSPAVQPVVFDALDASVVHAADLCTVGAVLDHLGLMLVNGGGCAPPFMQLLMNFVVQLLCLLDSYVLHSFLQIFSLHFWDASSLFWISPQEFGPLEFVRWCVALWQRLPSMLFEMTFKLQQHHINSVRGRLLGQRAGQRLLFML